MSNDNMTSKQLLVQRLRTWPLGEIGREAADEIERLQQQQQQNQTYCTLIADLKDRSADEPPTSPTQFEQARDAVVAVVRTLEGAERDGARRALNAICEAMEGSLASVPPSDADREEDGCVSHIAYKALLAKIEERATYHDLQQSEADGFDMPGPARFHEAVRKELQALLTEDDEQPPTKGEAP